MSIQALNKPITPWPGSFAQQEQERRFVQKVNAVSVAFPEDYRALCQVPKTDAEFEAALDQILARPYFGKRARSCASRRADLSLS